MVKIVFLHKDKCLLDAFAMFASTFNKKVDIYQNPHNFLENIDRYPKHSLIFLGQHFSECEAKGLEIAKYLHGLGFTELYSFSSGYFSKGEVPDYITSILNTEWDWVRDILNK